MHEDDSSLDGDASSGSNASRRRVLRTLGVGALATTAGCLFGDGEDDSSRIDSPQSASARTDSTRTGRTNAPSKSPKTEPVTPTHEQSIITTSAASGPPTQSPTNRTQTGTRQSRTSPSESTDESVATTTDPTSPTEARAGGTWRERAPLPVVGSDAGGGVLDGKLHFFGGIETDTGLRAVALTFAYDPVADAWERLPDLPRALWGPCGVATDEAIYSFGGAPADGPYGDGPPPTDAILRYRPDDGWTDLTASSGVRCPYPNWVMGGVFDPDDGLIYCVGGGTGAREAGTATDHGFGSGVSGASDERRLWTFDPANEEVRDPDRARLPEGRRWPTVALFAADGGRRLHVIGGLRGTTGPTDSNVGFDVGTNEFESMAPMPRAGTYATHSNPVIDGRAYLSHGMFWEGEPTVERYEALAHRYDPETDTFETDLPRPTHLRGGAVSGVIDGTLYVVGGHIKRFEQGGLHDCVAYNETYTPASDG